MNILLLAFLRSYRVCRLIQNSGVVLKYIESRKAVSAVITLSPVNDITNSTRKKHRYLLLACFD